MELTLTKNDEAFFSGYSKRWAEIYIDEFPHIKHTEL